MWQDYNTYTTVGATIHFIHRNFRYIPARGGSVMITSRQPCHGKSHRHKFYNITCIKMGAYQDGSAPHFSWHQLTWIDAMEGGWRLTPVLQYTRSCSRVWHLSSSANSRVITIYNASPAIVGFEERFRAILSRKSSSCSITTPFTIVDYRIQVVTGCCSVWC